MNPSPEIAGDPRGDHSQRNRLVPKKGTMVKIAKINSKMAKTFAQTVHNPAQTNLSQTRQRFHSDFHVTNQILGFT